MRIRRIASAFLLFVVSLTVLAPATALAGTTRQKTLSRINEIRSQHGLRRLDCSRSVNQIAQTHSLRMAATRTMYHTPDLFSKIRRTTRARTWGENVGYGPTPRRVIRLWMRSPSHRHNILNGRFRRCGIGAVKTGRTFWMTLILYG